MPAKKKIIAKRKGSPKKSLPKQARVKPVQRQTPAKKPITTAKRQVSKPKTKQTKNIIIGKIAHYFPRVNAAIIKVKLPLKTGDTIHIKGHSTDFKENVSSMQIEHAPIQEAKKGQEIGLFVTSRVRRGDIVYKI